ncbi:MAG: SufD family Fe-S cluster assembly protein [Dehalococcoidia bacterium]|nr:SufD family Fe-S cluster assembly protein [Dehalococcoidia bacterium]
MKTQSSRDLAEKAIGKAAALGPDIDLSKYTGKSDEHDYHKDPSQMTPEEKAIMMKVGVVLDDLSQRTGTFIQQDQKPVHFSTVQEGVEVMSISEAFKKHAWLGDYWWKAVKVDADKYTAHVELNETDGYFIRTLPGVKTSFPVQACLYLGHKQLAQRVHNVVIAEEGSELHIITGCTTHPMSAGLHLGVSEFYIKKGAKITFTMIHNWAPEVEVRPRSVAIIEDDGIFLNNYVSMKPVHSMQMYPTAHCVGQNSIVRFNSVLVAPEGSHIDVGSRAILDGKGARAEIVSRTITTGGTIIARGDIQANVPDVKGHLECRGLILGEKGVIHAIPELIGRVAGVDLSHEAAVGKIAEEEVEYLMARGLTRDKATAMIVRGFLKVDIEGLPPELEAELKRAIEESEEELF